MKTRTRLILLSVALLTASCFPFSSPLSVVEHNDEQGAITKRVKLGRDFTRWPPRWETPGHARERLLTDIRQECPSYHIVAEGTDSQSQVSTGPDLTVRTGKIETVPLTETVYFLWMRYRCNAR